MPRLIDADALICNPEFCGPCNRAARTAVICSPTIDAEPVRHAYWHELLGCGYTVCSACDFIPYSIKDKYCPHCGAKMDLKED